MELAILSNLFKSKTLRNSQAPENSFKKSDLTCAKVNIPHTVKKIKTNDREMKNFLFTLGCYEGESVTVISVLTDNYIINIKDARYSINEELAKAILI